MTSEADVILNVIAVVERDASEITQGEEKIRNFDTKATAHRRFCGDCGCHIFPVCGSTPGTRADPRTNSGSG